MFGLIVNVDNYTIQEHYKQLLADKVWLPYEVVSLQLNKYIQTDWKFEVNRKSTKEDKRKARQPNREMVSAALFYENIFEKYIEDKENWTSFICQFKVLKVSRRLYFTKSSFKQSYYLKKKYRSWMRFSFDEIKNS